MIEWRKIKKTKDILYVTKGFDKMAERNTKEIYTTTSFMEFQGMTRTRYHLFYVYLNWLFTIFYPTSLDDQKKNIT